MKGGGRGIAPRARGQRVAGCAKPAHNASRSELPPPPTRIDAARCEDSNGRWYTSATSEHQRPRFCTTWALASPRSYGIPYAAAAMCSPPQQLRWRTGCGGRP